MSDFRFKVLADDRLYVVLDALPEKTQSGLLYMPQTQAAASRTGTVVQVGPGAKDNNGVVVPVKYQPGDRVVVSSYAGVGLYLLEYGMVDATHAIYRESEIIGAI